MTNPNLEKAKQALLATRQYQEAWLEHGTNRVYLVLEDTKESYPQG